MSREKVYIYDTTLRDGEQGMNISYSLFDKLMIARKLDDFGVDYIEGGWPNKTNIKTLEFFREARKINFKNARLAAFGSTRMPGLKAEDDDIIRSLIEAETPVVTIFGKCWDLHVEKIISTTLEENLRMIGDTVSYLKSKGKEVVFDGEHFFDGYKNNPDYAISCLKAAEEAGADWIILADTNGGTLPGEIAETVRLVREKIDTPLGIHAHNDMETAVANSLAAVQKGARQVQGTINGLGERCGNANLTSIIPTLSLKMGYETVGEKNLAKLKELSHFVYEMAGLSPNLNQPYTGKNAFAHKGGIHANAIIKEPSSYEHIDPALVGNKRQIPVSEQAGISSLIYKAGELGIGLSKDDPKVRDLVIKIKNRENEGYEFDGADASLKLFMLRELGIYKPFFTLDNKRIIIEKRGDTINSETVIKLNVDGIYEHTAAEGVGPVNALDKALRKALSKFYPEIEEMRLVDYKVRVVPENKGTSAKVKVFIETADAESVWVTVGVSENIIEASWNALVDSVEYKLFKGARII